MDMSFKTFIQALCIGIVALAAWGSWPQIAAFLAALGRFLNRALNWLPNAVQRYQGHLCEVKAQEEWEERIEQNRRDMARDINQQIADTFLYPVAESFESDYGQDDFTPWKTVPPIVEPLDHEAMAMNASLN